MENNHFDKSKENSSRNSTVALHDFLDFLKLTCQVHESITLKDTDENQQKIDYNALAKNELVNSLISLNSDQSPKSDTVEENTNGSLLDKTGKKI